MKLSWVIACLFMLSFGVHAKSLGVLGQTFPVIEKSLLTLIHERLNSAQNVAQLAEIERAWVKKVESHVLRPRPLSLTRTEHTRAHEYTPTATLHQDIVDATGRVILKHGLSINALTQRPEYHPVWVFLNFDDPAQRAFADRINRQYQDIQWILTGGNVREAEQHLNQAIYFDQEGRISQKLTIRHVPTVVTRVRDSLNVVEYAIQEDGDAR